MERNNLKKITGSRWFLPVVCAVSFVFGWWYLSIITCAPLGGDDEIINLQNYYYITHTPWWQVVLTHAKEILNQLALQSPRFRPFSSPPVRSLNSWFLGDLVVYRLYILAWTYADITLTAWLTAKATHSKKLGALAFCLLGLGLQRLPGVGFSGKLSWGLALVCLVLLGLSRLSRRHRGWKILLRIAQIGLAALVLGLSAVEVWVIRAGHRDESSQPADAVIVLGAGVNGTTPSVALQTRIDAAERYLKAHPDIPAVLSGGQGPGEDISEARAMYDALTDRGIDPERLILEEQSANTRQNLQNSLALLPDDYHKTVAIVTNDFHMGRVRLLLNAAGPGRVVQVPAKLPWWWLSANYYLRESFAVVNDQVVRPLLA